jgi:hypothetical protein
LHANSNGAHLFFAAEKHLARHDAAQNVRLTLAFITYADLILLEEPHAKKAIVVASKNRHYFNRSLHFSTPQTKEQNAQAGMYAVPGKKRAAAGLQFFARLRLVKLVL